jgi:hypothetical protein
MCHGSRLPSGAQAELTARFEVFLSLDESNVCAVVVGLGSKSLPPDVHAFMRVCALECGSEQE